MPRFASSYLCCGACCLAAPERGRNWTRPGTDLIPLATGACTGRSTTRMSEGPAFSYRATVVGEHGFTSSWSGLSRGIRACCSTNRLLKTTRWEKCLRHHLQNAPTSPPCRQGKGCGPCLWRPRLRRSACWRRTSARGLSRRGDRLAGAWWPSYRLRWPL
jgi:hypothetical protein